MEEDEERKEALPEGSVPEENGETEREALGVFAEVERAIAEGRYSDADALLDGIEERGGEWYYQRAVLCKKRSWYLESSRCLQEAIRLDPENERYQEELKTLEEMTPPGEGDGKKRKKRKKNMGAAQSDTGGVCAECCAEGFCACLGEAICEGICDGC